MPKTKLDAEEQADRQALDAFRARWLTSAEAAQVLGIVPGAVRKILHDYPHIRAKSKRLGRDRFIPRRIVEEYARTKGRKAEIGD